MIPYTDGNGIRMYHPYPYFFTGHVYLCIVEFTGYSIIELLKIEHAFEMAVIKTDEGRDHWILEENMDKGQFMGLMAVLDVLNEIHGIEDNDAAKRLESAYESRIE